MIPPQQHSPTFDHVAYWSTNGELQIVEFARHCIMVHEGEPELMETASAAFLNEWHDSEHGGTEAVKAMNRLMDPAYYKTIQGELSKPIYRGADYYSARNMAVLIGSH